MHRTPHPRHHSPIGFLPIAPQPTGRIDAHSSSSTQISWSTSTSASASSAHTSIRLGQFLCQSAVGYLSGSEGPAYDSSGRAQPSSSAGVSVSDHTSRAGLSQSHLRFARKAFALDSVLPRDTFDLMSTPLPSSSSVSDAQLARMVSLISPLEGANLFDLPLKTPRAIDEGYLEYIDMNIAEGLLEDFVENRSRDCGQLKQASDI